MPSPFSSHLTPCQPDCTPLCGGDGAAGSATLLPGVQALSNLLGLLDGLVGLGKDELDVARVRHVGVDLHELLDIAQVFGSSHDIHGRERGMCAFAAWGPG